MIIFDLPPESVLELDVHEHKRRKKSFVQQLNQLRPIGFMGGISLGLTHLFNDLDINHPSWSAGIQGAVIFSPKLRLWLEANYTRNHFEVFRMNDNIGIPVVPPPSDDFVFAVAEAEIPAFLIGGGMEYMISPQRKWSPYLGVGYGIATVQPYEITYDFEDQAASIEWNFEKRVNQSATLYDFLILKTGMETRLNNNWVAQIGINFQTNWNDRGRQWRNLFQLQGKVLYEF